MNQKLFILCLLFLLCSLVLKAQVPTPDWAKQTYSSKGSQAVNYKDMAVDKQGNIYTLYSANGYFYAGGQTTPDSTANTVLTSWDCNGNLRWMKSLGTTSITAVNNGLYLEADSLGGIYISGYASSVQGSDVYWDNDTTISLTAGQRIEYLVKYNSQGQFQWLREIVDSSNISNPLISLSASPSGDVFWFALLDTGVYDGGAFTINTRKFYAVHYNASGNYQTVIPLDITPPALTALGTAVYWKLDPATNRFYSWLFYDTINYGSLTIGNATIAGPAGVLAAFNSQGQNIWVRQSTTNKAFGISDLAFGKEGILYLLGRSEQGAVFCSDTATNTLDPSPFLMALDTSANVLWSNYSAHHQVGIHYLSGISQANNTLVVAGSFMGILSWGNYSDTNTSSYGGYMLRANAATGSILQMAEIDGSSFTPTEIALDKNNNIYINSFLQGNMTFGSNNLSTLPTIWDYNQFLLKYKNVNCNCDLLQPAFNIAYTGGKTCQYTYTGDTPYTSINWDFGDGSPAVSGANPSHTYTSLGVFPVCVTVTNSCGSNAACKYVTIDATNVKDENNAFSSVDVYPNPATNEIMIGGLPQGSTVEILDAFGRCLKKLRSDNARLQIHLETFSTGIYLLRFTDTEGRQGSSLFVKE